MEKALEILKHYKAREIGACSSLYQYGEGNYQIQHTSFSVKVYDEAIAELEEAMKPKTCNTCKKVKSCLFHKVATNQMPTMNEVNAFLICFGCIDHEPKDNS